MKQRLLRHLATLDADVVIVDVGAGAGLHALDFFNSGDIRIVVTVPEPTASVDAYRFINLATVRESVTNVSTRNPDRRSFERLQLVTRRFLGHDLKLLGEIPGSQEVADSIKSFLPVVEADADCAASRAFQSIARNLDDGLVRLSISSRSTGTSSEEKVELPDRSTPRSPIA
ncbi:MAG TPA: hypothetical protein EYQ60_09580 [Myxococcales bacterium]|nr:hypothetical protein [Myxococcales bacterium]HIK86416.1 hypothetical protein [Myxococcales bacterium]